MFRLGSSTRGGPGAGGRWLAGALALACGGTGCRLALDDLEDYTFASQGGSMAAAPDAGPRQPATPDASGFASGGAGGALMPSAPTPAQPLTPAEPDASAPRCNTDGGACQACVADSDCRRAGASRCVDQLCQP